jgi:O-antigen/teichoic acid export membrane protein
MAAAPMSITGAMAHRSVFLLIAEYGRRALGFFGREFSWALSSNVIYYACQWGLVVVLAKLGTPADVGAYALGIAVTAPILMFASFQQRNLVASDVREEYSFNEYITFRVVSLAVAMLLVCGISTFTQTTLSNVLIIILVGLALTSEYVSETYFGLLQKHSRLDRVSLSLALKGPLCLISVGLIMWATHNVLWAAVALVLTRFLVLFCFDVPSARLAFGPHWLAWNWRTQQKLFLTALPLGVIVGLGGFTLNIPRYFIEYFLSKQDLGIFSALASLIGAGNLVMAALASCIIVEMAKAWARHDGRAYRSLFLRFLGVSALIGTAGVVLALVGGARLLSVLFRPEYAGNAGVLARIMAAGALGYVVCAQGYTLTAARKLLHQIPALVGSAAVTGLSCWILIPKRGLTGAAESWMLGSLFLLACNAVLLARMKVEMDRVAAWKGQKLATAFERE